MPGYADELAELMPETPADPGQGFGINLRRLIKLRGRMIVLLFLAITAPAAVLFWFKYPGEFVATGTLEFKNQNMSVFKDSSLLDYHPGYNQFVTTQQKIIVSPTILRPVAEDSEIAGLPAFAEEPYLLWHLLGKVEASALPGTELVNVTYSNLDRETARIVIDRILVEYEKYVDQEELELGGDKLVTLRQDERTLRSELDALHEEIREASDALGVPVSDRYYQESAESTAFNERFAQALETARMAETDLMNSDIRVNRIRGLLEKHEGSPATPIYEEEVERKIDDDLAVEQATITLNSTKQLYERERQQRASVTGVVTRLKNEVAAAEREVERLRAEVRGRILKDLLAQAEQEVTLANTKLASANKNVESLQKQLDRIAQERRDEAVGMVDIEELRRDQQIKRERLDVVQTRIHELELESKAPAIAKVVEAAVVSDGLNHKKAIKMILLTMVLATGLAVGLGLLLELLDQRIRSAEDVAYVTDLPVLATIPHRKEDKYIPANAHMESIVHDYPDSMLADQYRHAVARLLHWSQRGFQINTCAIVSPAPRDGKTSVACNLAIALAQADRRVLLVDLNPRSPEVEYHFGLKPAKGLFEMLSGDQLAQDPDRATEFENLYVLGPGLRPADLIDRLASKEMVDFLQGAERLFDHVIIDTPPTLLTAESKLIAPLVNGIVVVAGAGITKFGMLRRCIRSLEETGGAVLGVIVNGVRQAPGGYLRRNLKLYYKHIGTQYQLPGPERRKALPAPAEAPGQPATFVVKDSTNGDS